MHSLFDDDQDLDSVKFFINHAQAEHLNVANVGEYFVFDGFGYQVVGCLSDGFVVAEVPYSLAIGVN
jgi:hypothetical protein